MKRVGQGGVKQVCAALQAERHGVWGKRTRPGPSENSIYFVEHLFLFVSKNEMWLTRLKKAFLKRNVIL